MPRSQVTIRDVAARAGVSYQTVSRVINGSERVKPETRRRVEQAIAELGYQPNAIARSMARGRTSTLACFAPNLTDYTFASIIEGAEQEARAQGYFLLSASAPDEKIFAALIKQLANSRRVEAILVINPYADGRYLYLPTGIPTVFAGIHPRREKIHSVSLNDEMAAEMATQHLLDLGHENIALITGPMSEDCCQDRRQGFESRLHAAGLPTDESLIIEGDWTATSGYNALMHLAQEGRLPTAVFAQNDRMAVGVLRAARDLGLTLPTQLSVIGVDDIPLAAYFSPPLTTIHQDFTTIGQEAAKLLIRMLEEPPFPTQHLRLPATLVKRRSTGPCPADSQTPTSNSLGGD